MSCARLHSPYACTSRQHRAGLGLTLLIAAWVLLVGFLCWALVAYSFKRDAKGGEAVAHWPVGTSLPTTPGRPTMLVFLHPKCPCSRATMSELERIWVLHSEQDKSSARLEFVVPVPPDAANDWLSTDTVEQAKRLDGATLVFDPGGVEAKRFGAIASGTVMWFDPAGDCLYAGGVTDGRGHEGGNAGRDSVEQLMRGEAPSEQSLPAFGCRLCLPEKE
jgi:hypothetical protein